MSFCAAETISGSSGGRPGVRPRFRAAAMPKLRRMLTVLDEARNPAITVSSRLSLLSHLFCRAHGPASSAMAVSTRTTGSRWRSADEPTTGSALLRTAVLSPVLRPVLRCRRRCTTSRQPDITAVKPPFRRKSGRRSRRFPRAPDSLAGVYRVPSLVDSAPEAASPTPAREVFHSQTRQSSGGLQGIRSPPHARFPLVVGRGAVETRARASSVGQPADRFRSLPCRSRAERISSSISASRPSAIPRPRISVVRMCV